MAKINFIYRGTKEVGKLSIRLTHSKNIDYRVSTPLVSKKEYWFKRTTIKGGKTGTKHLQLHELSTNKNASLKNHKFELERVQKIILDKFLSDNNNGIPISKEWLKDAVQQSTLVLDNSEEIKKAQREIENKEKAEKDYNLRVYTKNLLSSAISDMFIKYQSNKNELKKYKVTLSLLEKYEENQGVKYSIKELNQSFADRFMNWALLDMKYKKSYINAQLKRFRASAVRAYENDEEEIIQVSRTLRTFKMFDKVYKDKTVITLSYDELDKIDRKEIPVHLTDAKKAILLGCETGLRYSDMNKLKDTNIKNIKGVNYWRFRTEKTDAIVHITISERILYLINKYGTPTTNYPDNGVKLNLDIKEVCKLCDINEIIKGDKATTLKINGKKEIRNIRVSIPKHRLITTRTFRRSFATNYYGKIDTSLITSITGHATEKQLRSYINVKDESNIHKTKQQIDDFHASRRKEKITTPLTIIPKTKGGY